ncbi:hypothetical protein, variant 1 [Aphanomyces invadans]|uniref:Protein FAM184A/B N-terminal domain-containing protein n=1 Tax=Aphanomyces invadans TaxID=157072 RepID=A0A024TS46_9STRA|nr:hypothetical protein, variant 1 [Aphanomyces invadans]ETV96955.1 hypothetical protein, variant 1 [Aphanomyces invadans]|eukprot:XP_008874201.1 hypothetical protein, variant 1 [Aphanomyces invadans]
MDPDLHLKMSKKIAQLTKVIFHLNTKNEDAAMELQATVYSHRKENEALAKEAAAKMAQLKESLDKREAQLKSMESIKKIKERHQKDKTEALDEFKRYKDEVKAQQARMEEQFQNELETMGSELRKARAAFQDRISSLQTALEAVQSKASHGQADLVAMRAKHTDEVADMVTQSNKKYNDMLTSQLNQQDQLRAEHTTKLAALEKAHQFQLQQLSEKAENDAKMAVRRCEMECNSSADSMKNDMVTKMERLLSEIETLRSSDTQLRSEKSELLQQLTSLRASMKQVEIDLLNEKRSASTLLQNADAALQDADANLAERQSQVVLLETELAKFRAQVEALDGERRQLLKVVDTLHSENQSTSTSLSDKENQWGASIKALEADIAATKKQLSDKNAEVQKLQSLIKAMDTQHAKSEDEIKTQLLAAQKKNKELLSNAAAATTREDAVAKQLETSQTDLNRAHGERQAAEAAWEATQGKLHASIAWLQNEVKVLEQRQVDMTNDHDKAVRELRLAAQTTSQSQQAELEKQIQHLQTHVGQLNMQLAAAQGALSTSENDLAERMDLHKKALADCKALQDQLKQVGAASQKDHRVWQTQLAALEAEKDKAAKRAVKDKVAIEKLEGELKIAKHKTEMNGRNHAEGLAALKEEHAGQLEALRNTMAATIQEAVVKAEATMQQHVDDQRAFLLSMHKAEVADMQEQVDLWKQKHLEAQLAFDDERRAQLQAHAATCRALELEHSNARTAAASAWQDKLNAMVARHDENVRQLTAGHGAETSAIQAAFTQQINAVIAQASSERDGLLAKHSQELQQLNQARRDELEGAATELARRLADLREKKDTEHRTATATLTAQHNQVVAQLEHTVESCNQTIARHVGSMLALENDKKALQKTISEKEAELVEKELCWQRDKDRALDLARKHHKVELEQTIEVHLHETQALNNQFDKTRALLHEQQHQLVSKIREWEQVYARRDSRLEDLNRIADLEHGTASGHLTLVRPIPRVQTWPKRTRSSSKLSTKWPTSSGSCSIAKTRTTKLLGGARMWECCTCSNLRRRRLPN